MLLSLLDGELLRLESNEKLVVSSATVSFAVTSYHWSSSFNADILLMDTRQTYFKNKGEMREKLLLTVELQL